MAGRYDILLGEDTQAPKQAERPKPVSPESRSVQTVHERANVRTTARANGIRKRIITRNSFEIYEDQMDSLREKSYKERRAGKVGSMSAMVRDAIDAFLAKK